MSYTRYPRAILWLVRGGELSVGGPASDAQPPFRSAVASFYVSKMPITNRQYEAYDPSFERSPLSPAPDGPAAGVSWHDAVAYCRWYAEVSRKPIRLPTEIEWEYACRADTTTRTFYGDDAAAGVWVWNAEAHGGRLGPLDRLRPNPFGLISMLGGVWEWTGSRHLPYPARAGDGRDDPAGDALRVMRGGSILTSPEDLGSGIRRAARPEAREPDVGFRIVREFVGGAVAPGPLGRSGPKP